MGWNWAAIYLWCFWSGLGLTALMFLTGSGHLHAGAFRLHLGHGHGNVAGKGGLGAVNLFSLTAFVCWFGGAGYLMLRYSPWAAPLVLGVSVLTGLSAGGLLAWFTAGVLAKQERVLLDEDTPIIGVVGRLSCTLPAGGVGEMLFSQNGARRSMPVRSEDGGAMERGAEVITMRYERGVAYVRRWEEFADGLLGEDDRTEAGEGLGSRE